MWWKFLDMFGWGGNEEEKTSSASAEIPKKVETADIQKALWENNADISEGTIDQINKLNDEQRQLVLSKIKSLTDDIKEENELVEIIEETKKLSKEDVKKQLAEIKEKLPSKAEVAERKLAAEWLREWSKWKWKLVEMWTNWLAWLMEQWKLSKTSFIWISIATALLWWTVAVWLGGAAAWVGTTTWLAAFWGYVYKKIFWFDWSSINPFAKKEKPKEEKKPTDTSKLETEEEEEEKVPKNTVDILEKKQERYYRFWSLFVEKLWTRIFKPKDNFDTKILVIKKIKYSKIKWKENKNWVEESLTSEDMELFFENIITEKIIKKLLAQKKTSEVLNKMGISSENDIAEWAWRDLNVGILLSLLSFTLIARGVWKVEAIPWMTGVIFASVLEQIKGFPWIEELKKDMEDMKEELESSLMPQVLAKEIMGLDWMRWTDSFSWQKKDLLNKLNGLELENKDTYITRLLEFKENFYSDIIDNKEYSFWIKDAIIENLTLTDILSLYLSYGWEIEKDLDSIDKFLIKLQLSFIAEKSNNQYKYFSMYVKSLYLWENTEDNQFEKLLIKKIIQFPADKWMNLWKEAINVIKEYPVVTSMSTGMWLLAISKLTPTWRVISGIKKLAILSSLTVMATSAYFIITNSRDSSSKWKMWLEKNKKILAELGVKEDVIKEFTTFAEKNPNATLKDFERILQGQYTYLEKSKLSVDIWIFTISENKKSLFFERDWKTYTLGVENNLEEDEELVSEIIDSKNEHITKELNQFTAIHKIEFAMKDWKEYIAINKELFLPLDQLWKYGTNFAIPLSNIEFALAVPDLKSLWNIALIDKFIFTKTS